MVRLEGIFFVCVSDPERLRQLGLDPHPHLTEPVALDALIRLPGENATLDFAR
jgi:hypothetical protein